jgi:hypothetical protein
VPLEIVVVDLVLAEVGDKWCLRRKIASGTGDKQHRQNRRGCAREDTTQQPRAHDFTSQQYGCHLTGTRGAPQRPAWSKTRTTQHIYNSPIS